MTTPITVLAEENEADVRKAAIHGFEVKEVNSQVLVQTHAVADTGADTNVTDCKLRDVLGRAALEDAEVDLQGCTGSSDNRKKDKLRIVTSDKEVTVIEARRIDELGFSGPNTTLFTECMKAELGISTTNMSKFDFNRKKIKPRVLI